MDRRQGEPSLVTPIPSNAQKAALSSRYHPNSYQSRQRQRTSIEGAPAPTLSTASPFQSPVSSEFPPESGLAPRPPSFPYVSQRGDVDEDGNRSKRWRPRLPDDLDAINGPDSGPPSVPIDVQRAPPPVSYRRSSGSTVPGASQHGRKPSVSSRSKIDNSDSRAREKYDGDYAQAKGSGRKQSASAANPRTTSSDEYADPVPPRNGSAEQRREWAPDRSPLQKLELTLHDITKEEKRAQVEEAELLAREAKAGRSGRRARRTDIQAAPSQPARVPPPAEDVDHLAEAGLVRALSNKHKDRLQRSATVDSRQPQDPQTTQKDSRGQGFEYQEQQYLRDATPPQADPYLAGKGVVLEDDYDLEPQPRRASVSKAQRILGTAPPEAPRAVNPRATSNRNSRYKPLPSQPAEWRHGQIARLAAEDLDLKVRRSEAQTKEDKAWWEGGDSRREALKNLTKGAVQEPPPPEDQYEEDGPTRYDPPLHVRCGPLLRYLGIGREGSKSGDGADNTTTPNTTSATRRRGAREFWRGTVMVVTTDSKSVTESPPKLRLFAQPVDLLPRPPAQLDEQSVELLPEHVDPIAGLTTASRTGRTLYVKPVEHLEERRDMSRFEGEEGLFERTRSPLNYDQYTGTDGHSGSYNRPKARNGERLGKYKDIEAVRLHGERGVTFWRFQIEVELGREQARVAYRVNQGPAIGFWVPARGQTMNIMFYSGNGFGLNVNPDGFSGPDPMWRDVLNTHQSRPFHVMIGGGGQIYNDFVTRETTLFREWVETKDNERKRSMEGLAGMYDELEEFYLFSYCRNFSRGLFGVANAQIPSINVWDDHDIIDGWGSYPERVNGNSVFRDLGNAAFKYYVLFQHHSVLEEGDADEQSWLLGASPGPYINELSRNVFMFLGRDVAFLGLDCRTERTKQEIVTEQTYDLVLARLRREIIRGETKHLIVLIGVPVAYPRLMWLETILTSRLLHPVKGAKRSGVLGGILHQYDGGVEMLDDLDDHWTATTHKSERSWLIQELQQLAAEKSIRVTILGGDVHLGAIGQFYSNPALGIAKDRDHRYMPNVISSAIVNSPPPDVIADALNRKEKGHTLDRDTKESMIPIFTHDVDGKPRNNKRLLPRRNWCAISAYHPGSTPPPTPPLPGSPTSPAQPSQSDPPGRMVRRLSLSRSNTLPVRLLRRLSTGQGAPTPSANQNGSWPASADEISPPSPSGDGYFPAQPLTPRHNGDTAGGEANNPPRPGLYHRQTTGFIEGKRKRTPAHTVDGHVDLEGGLEVVLNVEVSAADPAGITTPYRLLVPALWVDEDANDAAAPAPQLKRSWTTWVTRSKRQSPSLRSGDPGSGYSGPGHPGSDGYENEAGGAGGAGGTGTARTQLRRALSRGARRLSFQGPSRDEPPAVAAAGPQRTRVLDDRRMF
ncbi:MAG: hypothetical protein M1825_002945 [Sarcosagium campestre]|nr:MAG: hypothetical protein M1825_002945 [Sarcosagium campestre]